MDFRIFEARDRCRGNLLKYARRAFGLITSAENPVCLDAGCGTGVVTFALLDYFGGFVYAVDHDKTCLEYLESKAAESGFTEKIKTINDSVFCISELKVLFDIILAEGLLNVIGFKRGIEILNANLKTGGFIIIHDEYKDDERKKTIFKEKKLQLIDSYVLNETVWRHEYYSCLENEISAAGNSSLFSDEIKEINEFRKNPQDFVSVYYILRKLSLA